MKEPSRPTAFGRRPPPGPKAEKSDLLWRESESCWKAEERRDPAPEGEELRDESQGFLS